MWSHSLSFLQKRLVELLLSKFVSKSGLDEDTVRHVLLQNYRRRTNGLKTPLDLTAKDRKAGVFIFYDYRVQYGSKYLKLGENCRHKESKIRQKETFR